MRKKHMKSSDPLFDLLCGRAAVRRGFDHEWDVMRAFDVAHIETPFWFLGINWATPEMDLERGTDLVVESDIGLLYLQVKSSLCIAEKFLRKQAPDRPARQSRGRYNKYIAVVIIEDGLSPEVICARVFKSLAKIRDRLLAERSIDPAVSSTTER